MNEFRRLQKATATDLKLFCSLVAEVAGASRACEPTAATLEPGVMHRNHERST